MVAFVYLFGRNTFDIFFKRFFVQNQLFKLRQFTKGYDLAEFVELDFLQVKESSPRDIV